MTNAKKEKLLQKLQNGKKDTTVINVRVETKYYKEIEEIAKETSSTIGKVLNEILKEYFK